MLSTGVFLVAAWVVAVILALKTREADGVVWCALLTFAFIAQVKRRERAVGSRRVRRFRRMPRHWSERH